MAIHANIGFPKAINRQIENPALLSEMSEIQNKVAVLLNAGSLSDAPVSLKDLKATLLTKKEELADQVNIIEKIVKIIQYILGMEYRDEIEIECDQILEDIGHVELKQKKVDDFVQRWEIQSKYSLNDICNSNVPANLKDSFLTELVTFNIDQQKFLRTIFSSKYRKVVRQINKTEKEIEILKIFISVIVKDSFLSKDLESAARKRIKLNEILGTLYELGIPVSSTNVSFNETSPESDIEIDNSIDDARTQAIKIYYARQLEAIHFSIDPINHPLDPELDMDLYKDFENELSLDEVKFINEKMKTYIYRQIYEINREMEPKKVTVNLLNSSFNKNPISPPKHFESPKRLLEKNLESGELKISNALDLLEVINLETAVQDDKVVQGTDLESLLRVVTIPKR